MYFVIAVTTSSFNVEDFAIAVVKLMERNSRLEKNASDAASCWYSDYFHLTSLTRICIVPEELQIEFTIFATALGPALDTFINSLVAAPSAQENYVQMAFQKLYEEIKRTSFNDWRTICAFKSSRSVHTHIDNYVDKGIERRCIINGQPDATIVLGEVGVFTTELKSQSTSFFEESNVALSRNFKTACVQLVLYLKAEIENIFESYSTLPQQVFGLLTTGSQWCLVEAEPKVEMGVLKIFWLHTQPWQVDLARADSEQRVNMLKHLFMCTHNSRAVLAFLESIQLNRGLHSLHLSVCENDNGNGNGGDSGKGGRGPRRGGGGGGGRGGGGGGRRGHSKRGQGVRESVSSRYDSLSKLDDTCKFVTTKHTNYAPLELTSKNLRTWTENCQPRDVLRDPPSLLELLSKRYLPGRRVVTVSATELFEGEDDDDDDERLDHTAPK